jgi:16S rRNA processing protein RimM
MIDLQNCIAIGTIIKARGVHGQVVLRLDQFEFDNIKELEPVFIIIDGLPVPFFVSDYYEKDPQLIVISFEDYDTNADIEELVDSKVYIPVKNIRNKYFLRDDPELLIGYVVQDAKLGLLGTLAEIIGNENNPLFRVTAEKREILIPVQPSFILAIDGEKRIIHVQTPEGLVDLNYTKP